MGSNLSGFISRSKNIYWSMIQCTSSTINSKWPLDCGLICKEEVNDFHLTGLDGLRFSLVQIN